MFPILIPTYHHCRDEKIIEVDKHVDTVTIRKDLYDKYEKFYKEFSNFPNKYKYECNFEAADPKTMRWGGKFQFNFITDNPEELIENLDKICKKIVKDNIDSYKYVEEYRSVIGINFKKLQFKLEYLQSKWWYKIFFFVLHLHLVIYCSMSLSLR